jgi:hypothetical protein
MKWSIGIGVVFGCGIRWNFSDMIESTDERWMLRANGKSEVSLMWVEYVER